jgi:hypothetical protein
LTSVKTLEQRLKLCETFFSETQITDNLDVKLKLVNKTSRFVGNFT